MDPIDETPIDTTPSEPAVEPVTEPVVTASDADLAAFEQGVQTIEAEPAVEPAVEPLVDTPEGEPLVEPPAAEPDAAAVEADALGLKGKSNTRFRELAGEAATFAPIKAALAEHGITDLAQVPALLQRGRDADAFNAYMTEQGVSADQFTATVTYTALATRGNSGDLEAAQQALDAVTAEQAHWAKLLGKEAPGMDPMAEHADLVDSVSNGDMTRKYALEIVQARAKEAVASQRTQAASAQTQQTQAQQQAQESAVSEVAQLNASLKLADPAHFAERVKQIDYAAIRQLPPHMWAPKIEAAYWRVQPAARPAPVGAVPLRPTGNSAPMQQKPKSDLEAFSMGAASVR